MLKWVFGADTGPFRQGLGAMRRDVEAFAGSVQGKLAGIFGVGAIVAWGKEMLDQAGRIDDLAKRLDMSAESVQRVGYAAQLSGSDLEGVAKGLTILQKNLGDTEGASEGLSNAAKVLGLNLGDAGDTAADSSDEMAEAARKLGLSAENFRDLSPEDQLVELSRGYTDAADSGEALAAVMKLLGKSGADLIPLLSEGPEALKETMDEAPVSTNNTISRLAAMGDKIDQLKAHSLPVFASIVEGIMALGPATMWVGDTLTQHLGDTASHLKNQFAELGEIIKASLSFDWDKQEAARKRFDANHTKWIQGLKSKQGVINERYSDSLTEIRYGETASEQRRRAEQAAAAAEQAKKLAEDRKNLSAQIAALEREAALDRLSIEERIAALRKEEAEMAAEAAFPATENSGLEARKRELEIAKEIAGLVKEQEATTKQSAEEITALQQREAEIDRDQRRAKMSDEQRLADLRKEQEDHMRRSREAQRRGDAREAIEERIKAKELQPGIDDLAAPKFREPTIIADDLRKIGGGGNAVLSTMNPQAGVESRIDKTNAELREIRQAIERNGPRPEAPW